MRKTNHTSMFFQPAGNASNAGLERQRYQGEKQWRSKPRKSICFDGGRDDCCFQHFGSPLCCFDDGEMCFFLRVLQLIRNNVDKSGRRCSHDLWVTFSWVQPAGLASLTFLGSLWSRGWTIVTGIFQFRETARHSSLYEFHSCVFVVKCHVVNSRKHPISASCTWDGKLPVVTQDSWP